EGAVNVFERIAKLVQATKVAGHRSALRCVYRPPGAELFARAHKKAYFDAALRAHGGHLTQLLFTQQHGAAALGNPMHGDTQPVSLFNDGRHGGRIFHRRYFHAHRGTIGEPSNARGELQLVKADRGVERSIAGRRPGAPDLILVAHDPPLITPTPTDLRRSTDRPDRIGATAQYSLHTHYQIHRQERYP